MSYESFVNALELLNCVIGLILCSFLLYCLLFRSNHDLGTYRYLQMIVVILDASYTTAQLFVRERIVTAEGVFAMIGTSPYVNDKAILCAYVSIYTLTFVMIDYSFLYRLWAVKFPFRLRMFTNSYFVGLLISIALLESTLWFTSVYFLYIPTESGRRRLREDTLIEYGVDTMTQVMVMGDYYLEDGSLCPRHLCGVGFSLIVMGFCFGFMVYASSEIIHLLRETKRISKNTIRMQRQLFITLCLQISIALVFLYSPCGVMLLLPLFRIDARWMAPATPLLITFFLPLDALAVILSMTDYRKTFVRLLTCRHFAALQPTVSVVLPCDQQSSAMQ